MGIEKDTVEIAPGIRQVPGTPVVIALLTKLLIGLERVLCGL